MSNQTTSDAEPFDLKQVYNGKIAPLMAQIIQICLDHDLPFVASFGYRRDENGEWDFCSTALAHLIEEGRWPEQYSEVVRVLLRDSEDIASEEDLNDDE